MEVQSTVDEMLDTCEYIKKKYTDVVWSNGFHRNNIEAKDEFYIINIWLYLCISKISTFRDSTKWIVHHGIRIIVAKVHDRWCRSFNTTNVVTYVEIVVSYNSVNEQTNEWFNNNIGNLVVANSFKELWVAKNKCSWLFFFFFANTSASLNIIWTSKQVKNSTNS